MQGYTQKFAEMGLQHACLIRARLLLTELALGEEERVLALSHGHMQLTLQRLG